MKLEERVLADNDQLAFQLVSLFSFSLGRQILETIIFTSSSQFAFWSLVSSQWPPHQQLHLGLSFHPSLPVLTALIVMPQIKCLYVIHNRSAFLVRLTLGEFKIKILVYLVFGTGPFVSSCYLTITSDGRRLKKKKKTLWASFYKDTNPLREGS